MPSVLSRRHVAINTKRAAGVVPAVIQLSRTQPKKGEKTKGIARNSEKVQ